MEAAGDLVRHLIRQGHHRGALRRRGGHAVPACGKATQAGVGALAAAADRRLVGLARKGQAPAAGQPRRQRAQHHRTEHGTGILCHRRHVEQLELARLRAQHVGESLVVDTAVGELHLLDGGQRAPGRRDHGRAVGRHHAGAGLAHHLEQLAADQQVDAAGHGIQAEHGPTAVELALGSWKDLHVVGRRAGALRDAGDRRGLHCVAAGARGVDQPVGQHAAAFAAERAQQDRQCLVDPCSRGRAHADAPSSARRSGARTASTSRSCQRGFFTSSAR